MMTLLLQVDLGGLSYTWNGLLIGANPKWFDTDKLGKKWLN
jgi:hypothetical protein